MPPARVNAFPLGRRAARPAASRVLTSPAVSPPRSLVLLLAVLLTSCAARPPDGCSAGSGPPELARLVPEALLRQANRGRTVLGEDGRFALPKGVRRVWVDVGAHYLETTLGELERYPDLGLIAIEPLAECWDKWPASPRLIGIPVAVYLDRGTMDFHVNADDVTSSLAESVPGSSVAGLTRTIEVRRVPVLRLEDVLRAIPANLPVTYLKTDVQGVDLQVLQSAGQLLRRAYRVRAEVISEAIYRGIGGAAATTDAQMTAFMSANGFRLSDEEDTSRGWGDRVFQNVACWRFADRLLSDLRFEPGYR